MTVTQRRASATEALAEFAVSARFDQLPAAAVQRTKDVFLDCTGVILAGSAEPAGRIVTELVRAAGAAPKAAVFGRGFRTSAADAALANGTMGHALDYDDLQHPMYGHPTVVLMPAILAVGEERGASGADAIAAYAVGLEVIHGLALAYNTRHYEQGWHATATFGSIGAAAAVGHLLGLDTGSMRVAFGIAASEASGLRQNFGTMVKPLHAGLAARNGVLAVQLAAAGFTADLDIFESRFGFGNVLVGPGSYDPAQLTASLGRPFRDSFHGLAIKQYPSCGATHPGLDAAIGLAIDYDLVPEEIDRVECVVNPLATKILIYERPTTGLEGKFSLEYCVAVALVDRRGGLDQFTDERAADPRVRSLVEKIGKTADPAIGQSGDFGTRLTVYLKDGRTLSRQVDLAKGKSEVPLTQVELHAKFRDAAKRALTPDAVEQALATLDRLETLADVSAIGATVLGGFDPARV
ncbi:MAG: MmgE/PrpD family protein [Chloroflexi bacterium]|nr:MmgE/PrpD family protein [Chloroflexota bacterium]